jgi:hypothetical protein
LRHYHSRKACPERSRRKAKYAKEREAEEKLETRNPKFETNPSDQKAQNSKPTRFGFPFFALGFVCFGLFRISIFGFWIFFRWRLGAMNFVEVVVLNILNVRSYA